MAKRRGQNIALNHPGPGRVQQSPDVSPLQSPCPGSPTCLLPLPSTGRALTSQDEAVNPCTWPWGMLSPIKTPRAILKSGQDSEECLCLLMARNPPDLSLGGPHQGAPLKQGREGKGPRVCPVPWRVGVEEQGHTHNFSILFKSEMGGSVYKTQSWGQNRRKESDPQSPLLEH